MAKLDIESLPLALPDGVDYDQYVIGTYLVSFPKSIPVAKLAPALAIEQSTGTWVPVPVSQTQWGQGSDYEWGLPPQVEERQYIIQIAFPEVNFGPQIPMLLTTVVGNISMAGKLKVLDLRFPRQYVAGFQGPKFGIPGIRNVLGVKSRPLDF